MKHRNIYNFTESKVIVKNSKSGCFEAIAFLIIGGIAFAYQYYVVTIICFILGPISVIGVKNEIEFNRKEVIFRKRISEKKLPLENLGEIKIVYLPGGMSDYMYVKDNTGKNFCSIEKVPVSKEELEYIEELIRETRPDFKIKYN